MQIEFGPDSLLFSASVPLAGEGCISLLLVLLSHMTCFGQWHVGGSGSVPVLSPDLTSLMCFSRPLVLLTSL